MIITFVIETKDLLETIVDATCFYNIKIAHVK